MEEPEDPEESSDSDDEDPKVISTAELRKLALDGQVFYKSMRVLVTQRSWVPKGIWAQAKIVDVRAKVRISAACSCEQLWHLIMALAAARPSWWGLKSDCAIQDPVRQGYSQKGREHNQRGEEVV